MGFNTEVIWAPRYPKISIFTPLGAIWIPQYPVFLVVFHAPPHNQNWVGPIVETEALFLHCGFTQFLFLLCKLWFFWLIWRERNWNFEFKIVFELTHFQQRMIYKDWPLLLFIDLSLVYLVSEWLALFFWKNATFIDFELFTSHHISRYGPIPKYIFHHLFLRHTRIPIAYKPSLFNFGNRFASL